jgi:mono/diheme cytochrome c family protein
VKKSQDREFESKKKGGSELRREGYSEDDAAMGRKVVVASWVVMLALLGLVGLAMGGCTAQHRPSRAQVRTWFQLKRAVFWLKAPKTKDPLPATAEVVEAGQAVYSNQCSVCHGADGRATVLGDSMYPPATDLRTPLAQSYSDIELYYILWNGIGHTGMPKWDTQLQPAQVWQLIHFMRTLPGEAKPTAESVADPEMIARGHQLFKTQGCMECHSVEGKEADGPDLTYEGDRGRSREWLVGHLIAPAFYSPGSEMPSYGKLTGTQLDELSVFLNSLKRGNAMKNHNCGM